MTLAGKLGINLTENDLVNVTRVGRVPDTAESTSSSRPRSIVVRVARRSIRDELLKAARVRRGVTTEGAGLPEPPRRFYVNKRLTKTYRQLFSRARELKNRCNWRYVWTRDG